ncbi:hypothetical protein D3C72_1621830 [compost metagenome]
MRNLKLIEIDIANHVVEVVARLLGDRFQQLGYFGVLGNHPIHAELRAELDLFRHGVVGGVCSGYHQTIASLGECDDLVDGCQFDIQQPTG